MNIFWKLIGRNLFYPIAIFTLVTLWLLTTNSGCKASFWMLKTVIPGELTTENIMGDLMNRVTFKKLTYANPILNLSAEEVIIEPKIMTLLKSELKLSYIKLKNVKSVWKEKPTEPLFIENAEGNVQTSFNRKNASFHIQTLTGTWREMPLTGHANFKIIKAQLLTPTGSLTIGENEIYIIESTEIKNQFDWSVNINTAKKLKLNLSGILNEKQEKNQWAGQVAKGLFSSEFLGVWKLKNPATIEISSNNLTVRDIILNNATSRLQTTGDFYYDKQGLNANIHLASLFVPKQALTLKNLHLNIAGKIGSPLQLKGSGHSGEGKFLVDGTWYFNTEKKLSLCLAGQNLQIYNTRNMQIIGAPELTLNLINNNLFVQGTLQINQAYIAMQDQKNVALLSKDIILTQPLESKQLAHGLRIIPNLSVMIDNKLHFEGYGIDGIVGGKLTINERPDGLLTGNGKLTIKEGKYRLQGATRYIHRGHLLFPPGTLLKDPLLDIFISQNRVQQHANINSTNIGLYVQGTLLHPIYHPYSNDNNLKSADILSRLGFGQSETAGDENQRQLFAQTAFLFSGTANPFIDFLQKNLNLEEFNLESKPTNKTFYTQGGADTVLIIGKSLSEKIYLQYLQSIIEPITTIRLKYFLSRYFTASAETGSEGLGGDMTFAMERN